ncbi:MAG: hypothetical protein ACRYG8_07090 [Janthinobacterium lividum]
MQRRPPVIDGLRRSTCDYPQRVHMSGRTARRTAGGNPTASSPCDQMPPIMPLLPVSAAKTTGASEAP